MRLWSLIFTVLFCVNLFGDTPPPPSGTRRDLSNLTTTSINQSLIFNAATAGLLKTIDQNGSTNDLTVTTGTGTNGDNTGNLFVKTGPGLNTPSGQAQFGSGDVSGDTNTGPVYLMSGNCSGTCDPGRIVISPGIDGNGTRGPVRITDGSEGTSGQVWTSIDTSGTGHWAAPATISTPVSLTNGGTHADLSATGGVHQVLKQSSTGANVTVGQLACSDLSDSAASCATNALNASNISSGTLPAARLPNPSSSTLGGVQSIASASHNFLTSISTSGVPTKAQPACADISDASGACTVDTRNAANITSGTLTMASNILDGTDNTHNIGAASGVNRFANGYFGSSMNVGWNPRASGHSQTAIVPAAIEIYGGGSNAYTYQMGPSTGIAISNVGSGGRLITLADPSVAFASGTTGVNYLTATAGLMNFFGHIRATTTAPTVTVNANAGATATSTVSTATDVAGILNLTLGTSAWASGAQTKVNFNTAYTTAPIVVITANNAATATNEVVLGYYVTSTINDFTVNFANAGSAATALKWNYYVIETQ